METQSGGNAIQPLIAKVVGGQHLTREESAQAFQIILNGGATPAQIAGLLVALRIKGETVDEITGAVTTMRAKALPFSAPIDAIDVCGTGGDGAGTFNISTAVAIVVAGCGVPVVKHGNRAVSSRSGSADVMQMLGVNLAAGVEVMRTALQEANLCFLMAPIHHSAMRHVAPVRQELKLRTLFNLLGPLSNPANVRRQLVGVYDAAWVRPFAEVLVNLGVTRAWVVHGEDGLDELSLTSGSWVAEVDGNSIREFSVTPQDAGLEPCLLSELKGGNPETNMRALDGLLAGKPSAYRRIVLLNSAAALMVADRVHTLTDGVKLAAESIDSGAARHAVDQLAQITRVSND